jgi:dienelactone hydrolase
VEDPALPGPHAVSSVTGTTAAGVAVEAHYPGQVPGPRRLVLLGHGFQLPISQYRRYAQHLATHGMVAVLVDFRVNWLSPNHLVNAQEMAGAIDWAAGQPELQVDVSAVGAAGHSLGGKLAFHAAVLDGRIAAVLGLDPVDASQNCSAAACPDVTEMLPALRIPTGLLGETTDATGSFQACAPADANYRTFHDALASPTFAVTVVGANHMSFLDDPATCGLPCLACQAATAPAAQVGELARAYVAAFFRRHLRGETAYDAFLTGAAAHDRYVTPGIATIESR